MKPGAAGPLTRSSHGCVPLTTDPAASTPVVHCWDTCPSSRRPDEPVTRWWQSCRLAKSLAQRMEPPAPGLKRPRL